MKLGNRSRVTVRSGPRLHGPAPRRGGAMERAEPTESHTEQQPDRKCGARGMRLAAACLISVLAVGVQAEGAFAAGDAGGATSPTAAVHLAAEPGPIDAGAALSSPPLTLPGLAQLNLPPLSLPGLPGLVLPPLTLPGLPGLALPGLPGLALPPLTLPGLSLSGLTLPPLALPGLPQLPGLTPPPPPCGTAADCPPSS